MAYSGLQTIFDELGPGTGAVVAGEREAIEQQASLQEQLIQQQRQRELMLKNAQSQVMNPLLAQHQGLQNQGLEAGLPGIAADSRSRVAGATLKEGTLATDILAGNSNNQTTLGANQVKQGLDKGQLLAQAAANLDTVPPVLRTQALMGMLQQNGIDPQSPQVRQLLSQVPPEQIPTALRKMSEAIARSGTTAAQYSTQDTHAADRASAEKVAKMKVDEQRYATDARTALAKERLQATEKKAKSIQELASSGKLNYEKAAVAFETMADMETDPAVKASLHAAAQKYEKAAQLLKTANQANTVDVSKLGNGLPVKEAKGALGAGKPIGTADNPIVLK